MTFTNKKIKVAVHDGSFHPDDIFAVAILSLYLKKSLKIFRTRNPKIFTKMDYLLDIGGKYNPKKNKFDHHQENWNKKRKNGIPYATSGLLWKEYGKKITNSNEIAQKIDESIIQTIDAEDNGIEISKKIFENISPYSFSNYLSSFNSTWKEGENSLKVFMFVVSEAKKMLQREIKQINDQIISSNIIKEIYKKTKDKRILILDNNYSWEKTIINYPEPLFIIQPVLDKKWNVNAVKLADFKFENKLSFPESWAGKTEKELIEITGISDAIFCHNNKFLCVAKSKEGAIALAKLAIEKG
ncbi:MAG: MYG1 family protein [bacterium]